MNLRQFSREQWAYLSEDAHYTLFGTKKPASRDRIDYALGLETPEQELLGYMTVHEISSDCVYLQFGGAFKQGTALTFRGLQKFMDWFKEMGKKTIYTRVANTNTAMLRLYLKLGFLVVGVRVDPTETLLELMLKIGG